MKQERRGGIETMVTEEVDFLSPEGSRNAMVALKRDSSACSCGKPPPRSRNAVVALKPQGATYRGGSIPGSRNAVVALKLAGSWGT